MSCTQLVSHRRRRRSHHQSRGRTRAPRPDEVPSHKGFEMSRKKTYMGGTSAGDAPHTSPAVDLHTEPATGKNRAQIHQPDKHQPTSHLSVVSRRHQIWSDSRATNSKCASARHGSTQATQSGIKTTTDPVAKPHHGETQEHN